MRRGKLKIRELSKATARNVLVQLYILSIWLTLQHECDGKVEPMSKLPGPPNAMRKGNIEPERVKLNFDCLFMRLHALSKFR
jgi:hypothetical protein